MFQCQIYRFAQLYSNEVNKSPKNCCHQRTCQRIFPALVQQEREREVRWPIPPSPCCKPRSPADRERFLQWHPPLDEMPLRLRVCLQAGNRNAPPFRRAHFTPMLFRELFHDFNEIDLFATLTIASTCHLVYRTDLLPKDTIAVIPPLGYCPRNKQSRFTHKSLSYTAEKNAKTMSSTHATNLPRCYHIDLKLYYRHCVVTKLNLSLHRHRTFFPLYGTFPNSNWDLGNTICRITWGLLFSFVLKLNKFSSSCGPSLCDKQDFLKLSNHLAYYRHLSIKNTQVISLTGNIMTVRMHALIDKRFHFGKQSSLF